ncbi:MAG: hypothetical protein ORN85_07395 [Sediminibacterium sp.]|nr:hypothetical protein [Sediminibacterium sp.]
MLKKIFHFSRKEIKSAIILFALLLAGWFIPYIFIKPPHLKETLNNSHHIVLENKAGLNKYDNKNNYVEPSKIELFFFDPNFLDSYSWLKLGLKPKTIGTIKKYLRKGGKFNEPNDLRKIWGLSPILATKLIPYIKIEKNNKNNIFNPFLQNKNTQKYDSHKTSKKLVVEINEANFGSLIKACSLPPEIVGKVISFRNYLGKFATINQLKFTYNLTDSFYNQLIQHIYIGKIMLPCYSFAESKAGHYSSLEIFNKKDIYRFIKEKDQIGPNFNANSLSNIEWLSQPQIDSLKKYFY